MRKFFAVLAVMAALATASAAGGAWFLLGKPSSGTGEVTIEIPEGATTVTVAELLREAGVVDSVLGFRVAARLEGLDGKIQAGTYKLRTDVSARKVASQISRGPIINSKPVTFPEGFTMFQVAERMAEAGIQSDAALNVMTSGAVKHRFIPDTINSVEGFLFPQTYSVAEGESAEAVVRRMFDTFDSSTGDLDFGSAAALGRTPYEIVIIASLVEREAKVDDDRAQVAAVIHNRLKKGMRLQIDITALYGKDHKIPTRNDLRQENPYNTYTIDGLPPTPIANPGYESLKAALNPAPISAIYYVLIDPQGHHGFADTYEQFQELRKKCPPKSCAR